MQHTYPQLYKKAGDATPFNEHEYAVLFEFRNHNGKSVKETSAAGVWRPLQGHE